MLPRIRGKAGGERATRVAKGAPPSGGACVDGGSRRRAFWERNGGRNGEERDACRCRVGGVGLLRGGAALVREKRPASRERPPGAGPGVRGRPLPRGVGGGRTPARRRPLTTREPPGGVRSPWVAGPFVRDAGWRPPGERSHESTRQPGERSHESTRHNSS